MDNERFEQELLAYLEEKREAMTRRFHRVLPTGELLFNRYDKAAYLGAGFKDSIGYIAIVLILLFRPQGLFGKKKAVKV